MAYFSNDTIRSVECTYGYEYGTKVGAKVISKTINRQEFFGAKVYLITFRMYTQSASFVLLLIIYRSPSFTLITYSIIFIFWFGKSTVSKNFGRTFS